MKSPYYPARSVLFHKEPNGVTYRVPALLYLSGSKTMLAFCEERLSPSDSQAHLLVMRKDGLHQLQWEDMHVLGTAFLPGHRSMNPCPVHDEFTGTVFLFFIAVLGHTSESQQLITGKNVTRLCFVSSLDNGDTWSPVTDLTQTVIGETIKEWATFALGPGHGIQLKSGRLMIPAYTTPRAFCFHSDTHGRTWRFGEAVPGPESVECQVVSVDEEDGTNILYCNARSPLGYRVQALSLDDGAVFQEGQLVPRLVEPRNGCHGSIVGFPHRWPVFYCHPTWNTARKDLGVFLSLFPRDPDSWRGPWVIYDGPSAYSDVAYLELSPSPGAPPAVAFACLFECGTNSAYDQICFSIFTLYELIDHLPHNVQQAATSKEESQTIRNYFDSSKTKPKKKRKGKVKVCTIL
uniref:exo-alpha-sialidase n=1 Tax=Neogobius melanostomus TaxID=47308 RepID=A0A8C6T0B2_9GOBI